MSQRTQLILATILTYAAGISTSWLGAGLFSDTGGHWLLPTIVLLALLALDIAVCTIKTPEGKLWDQVLAVESKKQLDLAMKQWRALQDGDWVEYDEVQKRLLGAQQL